MCWLENFASSKVAFFDNSILITTWRDAHSEVVLCDILKRFLQIKGKFPDPKNSDSYHMTHMQWAFRTGILNFKLSRKLPQSFSTYFPQLSWSLKSSASFSQYRTPSLGGVPLISILNSKILRKKFEMFVLFGSVIR